MGSCGSHDAVDVAETNSSNDSYSLYDRSETDDSTTQQPQVKHLSISKLSNSDEKVLEKEVTFGTGAVKSPSIQPLHRHMGNFVVVWLDATVHSEDEDIQRSKNEMQRIVNEVQMFSDVDLSLDWIKDVKDKKVFLIVSDSLVEKVMYAVQHLSQVDIVYVLTANKEVHEKWTKIYRKVKGVFTSIHSLCEQLKIDTRKTENSTIGFDVVGKSASSSFSKPNNKQEASFIYAQLFKELLLETNDECKEELIDFCREQYSDNPDELEIISEFERDYQQSDVIRWYTRETFLYKMISKALRTQDHLALYALRFFIRDLHRQLAYLQAENKSKNDKLILYRGQAMPKNDFEKLKSNSGGLLSINTFLSTSEKKNVVLGFIQQSKNIVDTELVLFQIDLNPMETSTTPYADIDKFSVYRGVEKEHLFSMGSVFRIGSVTKIDEEVWCIRLTLTKDNDQQLEQLTDHLRCEIQKYIYPWAKFGKLMNSMGLYRQAEEFYKLGLNEDSSWYARALAIGELGTMYAKSKHLDEALECFEEQLKILSEHYVDNDPCMANIYSNIGYIHQDKRGLNLALEYYQRALDVDLAKPVPDHENIALSYNNIGTVLDDQGKFDDALTYYQKTLDIRQEHLPAAHHEIAIAYNNIGHLYEKQGKNEEALDMHEKSLAFKLSSLPPDHPSIAVSHSRIASSLHNLGRREEALKHRQKALQICTNALGKDHEKTQRYQKYVDQLRRKMKNA